MQKHPQHCLSKHPSIIVRFCKCLVYHVMNCGEGCAFIFHGKAYTDVFSRVSSRHMHNLASKAFVKKIKELARIDDREVSGYKLLDVVSMEQVVHHVATHFDCDINDILYAKRGQGQKNQPRRIALYCCQQKASATLSEIARVFNVSHYSTVS